MERRGGKQTTTEEEASAAEGDSRIIRIGRAEEVRRRTNHVEVNVVGAWTDEGPQIWGLVWLWIV